MSISGNQSLGYSKHTCGDFDGWQYNAQEETAIAETLVAFTRANDKRERADRLKDYTLREEANKDLAAAQASHAAFKAAYEKRLDGPCSACSVSCTILRNGDG
jgi:hypothetical protein